MNFYVGDFYKNLLIRFTFGEDSTTMTLRENLCTFVLIFRHLQDKCKACNRAREARETVEDMYRVYCGHVVAIYLQIMRGKVQTPLSFAVFLYFNNYHMTIRTFKMVCEKCNLERVGLISYTLRTKADD